MLHVKDNRWVMGQLGVFDLPKNIRRCSRSCSWRVVSEGGSFWEFKDIEHGSPYYSLKEAVRLAITIASLPYKEASEYTSLLRKGRLSETGVTGVYYRKGLKESYKVIYNGQLIKIPYDKGKGFTRAVRALEEILDPTVEFLREKFRDSEI